MNIQESQGIKSFKELVSLVTKYSPLSTSQIESLSHDVNTINNCKKNVKVSILCNECNIIINFKQLKLCNCKLTKFPIEVCQLKYLTSLNLSNNLLESLPNELGNLCNLVTLQLSNNKLKTLPKTLRFIYQLNFLDISHNEFSEEPEVLHYGLRFLRALGLSFNKISLFENPPACLSNLLVLDLSDNALKYLPTWIYSSLSQLQSLNVSNNPMYLDSEILSFFGSRVFESLQLLNIENCNCSSKNIKLLYNFKNLKVLHLGNKMEEYKHMGKNYFINFSVKTLENFQNVKYLYLQNVHIATLPPEFDRLKNIKILDLSNNFLSWMPDTFCNISSLKIVYLTSNQLLFLPSNVGNLVHLQQFHLGNNMLEEIPESFYNLKNLEFVDFYNNKIKKICEKIFEGKNLKGLDLELNCLKLSHPRYDSLKTCFRKFIGVLDLRSDAQKTDYQKSFDDSSIGSSTYESMCSVTSFESGKYSDPEDQFEDCGVLKKYSEDEDWGNNSFEIEKDDAFDPNDNSNNQPFRNFWESEFQKNYCPASYHVPSLMTTFRRNYELALKEEVIEGQFDSD